jgi:hypothetical protein
MECFLSVKISAMKIANHFVSKISLVVCIASLGGSSFAQQLFPYGSEAKYDALASAYTEGSSAAFYNPAMIRSKGLYPELSYIRAMQSYEHPGFDRVKVQINSPAISIGVTYPITDRYHLGFTTLPTRLGELEVPGLPRRIVGRYQSIHVKDKSTAFESALGFSYRHAENLSFGFGLLHSYLERQTQAWLVGNPTLLLKVKTKDHFFRPIIGMRFESSPVSFASSLTPEQKRPYKGRQISAASDFETDSKTAGFEPLSMRFAILYHDSDQSVKASINYLAHSKGEQVISEGVTSDAKKADISDVVERSLRYERYFQDQKYALSLAAGLLPTPWGGGVYDENEDERNVLGADFGQANNVTRRSLATRFGYIHDESLRLGVGSFYTYGKRTVGEHGDKPGFYQSQLFMLNAYTHWVF